VEPRGPDDHSTSDKAVYIKVTHTYRRSSESVKGVKPVWLDIDESRAGGSICGSDAKLHPTDVHRILSMSTCTGDPPAVVRREEVVRHGNRARPHSASGPRGS
jgi:hypothetical protein